MKLTHYFTNINTYERDKLFQNITDYNEEAQKEISKILAQKHGRALKRFKNYEVYASKRKKTEIWLKSEYELLSGISPKENPFYFVLGESETLFQDFGDNVGIIQIELDEIKAQDITLTLGDSMGVYFNNPNKKLYTLSEFLSLSTKSISDEFSYLPDYHKYIEVQHWNKSKIEEKSITISYPSLKMSVVYILIHNYIFSILLFEKI